MPYVERDVSRDREAAQEMVRRSGQTGVPVITFDGNVVVGFDEPRLERLLTASRSGPRLGASVAPRSGALVVGQVHPGTAASEAGLRPGDLILALDGVPVAAPEQLQQRLASSWGARRAVRARVQRDGQEIQLSLVPPP